MNAKQVKKNGAEKAKAEKKPLKSLISDIKNELEQLGVYFAEDENVTSDMTGKDRLRLISAGVRNNGFIDKAFDIARDNPGFMPPNFNLGDLTENNEKLEELRQLMLMLQQFERIAQNTFIKQADLCYREALRIYGSLREQSRGRVPGASTLFAVLRTYFRKTRRNGEELTEHKLEMDVKKLVHGKADGEIIIRNEQPKLVGGVHSVVDSFARDSGHSIITLKEPARSADNLRTGRIEVKETAEEEKAG